MLTYEKVKNLEEYKKILDMGFEDETTPILKKNVNIRFSHHLLGDKDRGYWATGREGEKANFVVYQNGYVRTFVTQSPAPVQSLFSGPLLSEADWNEKLALFRQFMVKKFLRDFFGVTKRDIQDYIGNKESWGESVVEMFKRIPTALEQFIEKGGETTQAMFLDIEGMDEHIAKAIQKNPGRWASILKGSYKSKSVQDAIKLLPPEMGKQFSKDLGLFGDLHSLGL